jgi:hypothetical protein
MQEGGTMKKKTTMTTAKAFAACCAVSLSVGFVLVLLLPFASNAYAMGFPGIRNRDNGGVAPLLKLEQREHSAAGAVKVVGRHRLGPNGEVDFDHPGVTISAVVTGTKTVSARMSKVGPVGVYFTVACNGKTETIFGTSSWAPGVVQEKIPLCSGLDPAAQTTVKIQKITEASWNSLTIVNNYVTFHAFNGEGLELVERNGEGDDVPKIEFLGDSITAGFCNMCETKPSLCPAGQTNCIRQESFGSSWANLISKEFNAESHTIAWSGYGMVMNCCGGKTLMSDIYKRTLASVPSPNPKDPHGTTSENYWNFSSWRPDAVVINLGTNDRLNSRPNNIVSFNQTYLGLAMRAAKSYGAGTHFFLACGPMSTAYCDEVQWVVNTLMAHGVKASFLDQRGFLDGSHGPSCCGHPSASVDQAMARKGAAFIQNIMGWNRTVTQTDLSL